MANEVPGIYSMTKKYLQEYGRQNALIWDYNPCMKAHLPVNVNHGCDRQICPKGGASGGLGHSHSADDNVL
ncbi:MAG: hypothetical protein L6244_03195 [Candidatus Methanoperedenaceae archaeon]|nr:hypothetical protein [Euryarchaeota archaeon]MCG2727640.1 hypothetical protein [Candidatus Methanoperedenaceae archaeon]